jgi:SHS2 domain-containing protein
VRAGARGEAIDRARHELLLNVKAVTYHNMQLDLVKGEATIVFDI